MKITPPRPVSLGAVVYVRFGFLLGGFALPGASCHEQALPVARPAPT